jgi:hypothetical protein
MMNKNPFLLAVLVAAPVWCLIAIDVILWRFGVGFLPAIVHAPGFLLMLAFNPSWAGMHNYSDWQHLFGNFIFYYLLALVVILVVRRFRRPKSTG